MPQDSNSQDLRDYAIVGNLHTAAVISKAGSIDFLCYPRFDSPSIFTRLLQPGGGGNFSIAVSHEAVRSEQHYLPDTAILITRHHHREGIVQVTDFMPPSDDVTHCQLIRKVEAITGSSEIEVAVGVMWPYGKTARHPKQTQRKGGRTTPHGFDLDDDTILLYSDDLSIKDGQLASSYTLKVGDSPRYYLLQSNNCADAEGDLASFCESLLDYTNNYWQEWSSGITYEGEHRNMVRRSAITLKLCTSAQYGSSVAAITTSLPESVGGDMNWDYRYSWIRDSAFSMYAMLRLGLTAEAEAYIGWIQERCKDLSDAAKLGLMYRVDGGTDLEEKELPWLEGYRNSTPVRIGNGAAGQRQLDIYGELIDTVYLYDKFGNEITYAFWQNLVTIIDFVCETWREPDHGIWEERGDKKQYTMSKVMAWVAVDRGIRIAEHRGFPAPHKKWLATRDSIYTELYEVHYNKGIGAWTQTSGNTTMDGSLLMMPLVRFVMTNEPNWESTLKQIEAELCNGALVYRKPAKELQTGYDGTEGYFLMCTFWYIEVLAKAGRIDEARKHMAEIASYASPTGLYAEELSMDGKLIGNFPQAFTHLGFISAALQIEEKLDKCAGAKSGPEA